MKLLSIDEVARRLGLSGHTVRYYLRQGLLPKVRIGRRVLVEEDELEKLVRKGKTQDGCHEGCRL